MAFSTPFFIFFVLPLFLLLFAFIRPQAQNGFLLACSLLFYVWNEGRSAALLLIVIALTLFFGRLLVVVSKPGWKRWLLRIAVALTLLPLVIGKYSTFFSGIANRLLGTPLAETRLPLPLGLSFFTFLAISHLVDLYRRNPVRHPGNVATALYLSFFPTVLAGPITPWRQLEPQLLDAGQRRPMFHEGVQRFIIGLGKKVLLADILATTANAVFAIPGSDLTGPVAWIGLIAYTLQIYFDFSGYTDMAVGLGRIMGFRLAENFRFPYAAASITDFWRRWHLSLTQWLRDYLFLPLAYAILRLSRRERWLGIRLESWSWGSAMLLTMLVCGLWHGAAWTFVAWGGYHGLLLLLERFGWGKKLKRQWRPLGHLYAVALVMIGWVLFRSPTLATAWTYLKALAGFNPGGRPLVYRLEGYLNTETVLALVGALFASLPLLPLLKEWLNRRWPCRWQAWLAFLFSVALLLLSLLYLGRTTYQPFLYARF